MEGPNKERWIQLSAQAAVEQDPKKLLELVNELNALLEEKELRLAATVALSPSAWYVVKRGDEMIGELRLLHAASATMVSILGR